MANPLILVTGATGKTGSAVVHQLLEQGQRARAVVHRLDARSERLRQAGAELVVADLFDSSSCWARCAAPRGPITARRSTLT